MEKINEKRVDWFHYLAILEGYSFLAIIFVTMPLKYFFDQPKPNLLIGNIHGLLFMLYVVGVGIMWKKNRWSIKKVFLSLLASIIPFGTFWADKKVYWRNDL